MAWSRVGLFFISPEWQFSQPVEGEFFRIKNSLSAATPFLWSGLICQSNSGFNEPLIYESRQIWAREKEWTVFNLSKPEFLPDRSIGIRRLGDFRTSIQWQLILEVWKSPNPPDPIPNPPDPIPNPPDPIPNPPDLDFIFSILNSLFFSP